MMSSMAVSGSVGEGLAWVWGAQQNTLVLQKETISRALLI
jgi:hypothetical protein